ncbi:uncharacterized protein LOC134534443 [Bacillus rossius redtenbacheri]|uniref:uncharacterized protein LOC134534443 n=1 Tax=Bacillus rossius redtenbacheri TaxID=93214 RepID=UPI002FDE05E1
MSARSRPRLPKKRSGDADSAGGRRKAEDGARRTRFDWSRVKVPAKRDFVDYVHGKAVNFEQPDVRVVAGDLEFNCHAAVLRSYSGFFRENTAPCAVLPPAAASSATFSALYDWMLAAGEDAHSVLNRDNVVDVLASARRLRVPGLARLCERLLADETLFPEYAAFCVMVDAGGREGLDDVRDLMLPRVSRCFLHLVATDDFARLSADEACRLLGSDHIAVHGELEVLFAASLWLLADWDARRPHLPALMRCVRFGLVPAEHLLALRGAHGEPELRELVSPASVQELLSDGLSYSALRGSAAPGDPAELEQKARSLGCRPQVPRCPLRDGEACPASYREFLEAVELRRPSRAFQRRQQERRALPLYQRPASLPRETAGCFVRNSAVLGPADMAQTSSHYAPPDGLHAERPGEQGSAGSRDSTAGLTSGASGSASDCHSSTNSLLTCNASTQTPFPELDDE